MNTMLIRAMAEQIFIHREVYSGNAIDLAEQFYKQLDARYPVENANVQHTTVENIPKSKPVYRDRLSEF